MVFKKAVAACIIVASFVFLFGCSYFENVGHIADENGAGDIRVVSISDEEICGRDKSVSYKSLTSSSDGLVTVKKGRFSGVKTITNITADGEPLTYNISTTLGEGNLRLVVVSDDEIVGDIEIGDNKILTIDGASGRYYLKIVGESAKFELSCTVTVG